MCVVRQKMYAVPPGPKASLSDKSRCRLAGVFQSWKAVKGGKGPTAGMKLIGFTGRDSRAFLIYN